MDHLTNPMTSAEREAWVTDEAKRIGATFAVKFLRGQREHGSDLGNVPIGQLVQESRNETLDQMAYVAEMERRFNILLYVIKDLEERLKLANDTIEVHLKSYGK